ncbi:VanZ family protein [Polymorphospora sp. NPDC050346]|uniref:VanZ family protein n=1 Tax=Polymorphospora sp. NPDC050346 TaxID=3155780 RepID=UPI0033FB09B5
MAQVWRDWGPVLVASAVALPLAGLFAVLLTRLRRRSGLPARVAAWRSVAEVGMVAGTLPWIWMILTPRPAPRTLDLVPLRGLVDLLAGSPAVAVVQIGGNLLVFAALGFFAPIRFAALSRPAGPLRRTASGALRLLAVGAAGSVLVETLQYALDLGRVSAVDDVLVNGAGAMLAALVARHWWGSGDPVPPPVPVRRGEPERPGHPALPGRSGRPDRRADGGG